SWMLMLLSQIYAILVGTLFELSTIGISGLVRSPSGAGQ
ncbi:MAG: hypothetical protein ACI9GB_003600, partial [Halioglobus sp.]